MSLKERVYSVLIVSASEALNTVLQALLPSTGYEPIRIVSDVSAAKRAFAAREYDYVVINSPLPDDSGIRFAIDACHTKSSVVLLLVRAELHDEIFDRVAEHGVFTLPKPTSRLTLLTALNWLSSARERLRVTEKKTLSVEEKMEEIRLVNRAKWLLIRTLEMEEPEAHRHIEKQAMDRCLSKREIAEEIINQYG